ncbi:MAG: hypothetical protein ACYTEK_25815 [Planctomycetota bacterium]|jgi:hypothetical protein
MKEVARIGVSILGLYLIARALSLLAGRTWYVRHVDIGYLVRAFGPTTILFCGGVICLAFRDRISSWILAGQKTAIPSEIDLERIECIIFSLIGILVFLRAVGASGFAITQFIAASSAEVTDAMKRPVRGYAYAQTVAVLVQFCLASILMFFPHRVQALLRKTRGF